MREYDLPPDGRDWTLAHAVQDARSNRGTYCQVAYHPFDCRWTLFSGKTKGLMAYPRAPLMSSMLRDNVALLCVRNARRGNVDSFFVANMLVDKDAVSPFDNARFFPLYVYRDDVASSSLGSEPRVANLDLSVLRPVLARLGLNWLSDGAGDGKGVCGPDDVLHYVYAILHSPQYRERYKEFLRIDYPRIPFTTDRTLFWRLAAVGQDLVALHLLAHPALDRLATRYPITGTDTVEAVRYDPETRRVYLNEAQYVEGVAPDVWAFRVGGYQPLQKWLKDRKGRTLASDDLRHYQRVAVALSETRRLMEEVDRWARFPMS